MVWSTVIDVKRVDLQLVSTCLLGDVPLALALRQRTGQGTVCLDATGQSECTYKPHFPEDLVHLGRSLLRRSPTAPVEAEHNSPIMHLCSACAAVLLTGWG